MAHTSSFEIKNAETFFNEMVLPQYEEFLRNNSFSRYALLTTIMAYHLYEWVHKKKFTLDEFKAAYPAHTRLAQDFEVARNITNGTKHFSNKSVTTRTQMGFSSEFSDEFARLLIIKYLDGTEISADQFLWKLIEFALLCAARSPLSKDTETLSFDK